jgi:hypothetical protein
VGTLHIGSSLDDWFEEEAQLHALELERHRQEKKTPAVYIGGNTIRTRATMQPRAEHDYYRTDPAAIRAYFETHPLRDTGVETVLLDPCAGDGVWGEELIKLYPTAYIVGVELQEKFAPPMGYHAWVTKDFLRFNPDYAFDAVVANPPFRQAEEFFHKARSVITSNGSIIFLLRLGFLASERRYHSMFSVGLRPTLTTVLNTRPSFTGDGKTYPGDFCMMRWDFTNGVNDDSGAMDNLIYTR